MYAVVHDAALVTGKAMENFLTSRDGESILRSYGVNGSCPLRSMRNENQGLGRRILKKIKKVRSLSCLLPELSINGYRDYCYSIVSFKQVVKVS